MKTLDPSVQGSSVSKFQQELMGAQDPMGLLTSSGTGRGSLGEDASKGRRVELALCWGPSLLELHHLDSEDAAFTVGDLEHPLPNTEESQALISVDQGALHVHLSPSWTHNMGAAAVDLGDTLEVELDDQTQLIAAIGEFTLVVRQVDAARKVVGKKKVDVPFIGVTAFSAFMAAMLGVLAWNAPPTQTVSTVEVSDAVAQIFLNPPEEPEARIQSTPAADKEGGKHEGEAGKVGRKDALMDKAKGNPIQGRQRDRDIAAESGLLGAMQDSGIAAMMGGGLDAGLSMALGSNAGPKGVQIGVGGFARNGTGPGGGGEIGSLDMGTGLRGPGNGLRDYEGQGLGTKATMALPTQRETIILGALDRSQIDGVIKNNLSKFRYCYQRELTKDPSLGGKVTVKFTIAKDGQVSASKTKASSVGNAAVEGCLNKTMMKLKFPQPKGEGIVIVAYPFLFSPG